MNQKPLISLTTDFGHQDAYVGMMKGVIAGIAPDCRVIDLCHEIPPQDIERGALVLWSAIDAFAPRTIHVIVVDPGVGSDRRSVLVGAGGQFFIGPDNGVMWSAVSKFSSWKAVVLENNQYFRPNVSHTFHGRDIFSPVAAHLASGIPFDSFGPVVSELQQLTLFDARKSGRSVFGRLIDFDHFGNAITNIPENWLHPHEHYSLRWMGESLALSSTFSDVEEGQVVAFIDSFGLLEIAIRGGSAQRHFRLERGHSIEVYQH